MKRTIISIIIPTLNEERNMQLLLKLLEEQTNPDFEVIVVDGGSKDETVEVANKHGAKTIVLNGCGEFSSRNFGVSLARGEILLFTCADVVLPSDLLEKVCQKFKREHQVIAVSGPGIPHDASLLGKVEYAIYNVFRFISTKLPRPFRRFVTSTNFLAVRKNVFERTDGFDALDINADGIMGRKLSNMGRVKFCWDTHVFISARRMKNMGFFKFNVHYLYVLENFFPFLSGTDFQKKFKQKSGAVHRKLHEAP